MLCTDARYRAVAFSREHSGPRFDVPPPQFETNSNHSRFKKSYQRGEVSNGVMQQSSRNGEPDT